VGEVEDTTWKGALEPGWTDTALTELFANVAVNFYTNYSTTTPAPSWTSCRTRT
jgi:hypothetical protein